MADPQQELFTRLLCDLRAVGKEKGYGVYDGALPPDDTPYPFVYLADFRQADRESKSAIFGSVYPTIHVWHNRPDKRGTVSSVLLDIKTVFRDIRHTDSLAWFCRNVETRILNDNTTKAPLLHGIVTAEFCFS